MEHKRRPNLTSHWQPSSQAHGQRAGRSFTYTPLGLNFWITRFQKPRRTFSEVPGIGYTCESFITASPTVLSVWLQRVKFIAKKSKCAGLTQEIGFSAPNSRSVPWLVNGATELCTSQKECNKLGPNCSSVFLIGRS